MAAFTEHRWWALCSLDFETPPHAPLQLGERSSPCGGGRDAVGREGASCPGTSQTMPSSASPAGRTCQRVREAPLRKRAW